MVEESGNVPEMPEATPETAAPEVAQDSGRKLSQTQRLAAQVREAVATLERVERCLTGLETITKHLTERLETLGYVNRKALAAALRRLTEEQTT